MTEEQTGLKPLITIPQGSLFQRVDYLIEYGQRAVAQSVNAAQTLTFWRVGQEINLDILREHRADYGEQIVSTLSTQLSWSHIVELLPLPSQEARLFYAEEVMRHHLGVRELRRIIDRKAFERKEIANAQVADGGAVPLDVFRDPYLLDFTGLTGAFQEKDLEAALLHDMCSFLLEAGRGFAFVEEQKRMVIDGEDYYLDLLFYSRALRRLVAVELKVGKFQAAYDK